MTADTMAPAALSALLTATATRNGSLREQAAVRLLVEHEGWLHRGDFRRFVTLVDADHDNDLKPGAFIDWHALTRDLDTLPGSGSAWRILSVALSIARPNCPVDLADVLGGLDATNIALVCRAILHANGNNRDALVWVIGSVPPGALVDADGATISDPATLPDPIDPWTATTPDPGAADALATRRAAADAHLRHLFPWRRQ